MSTSGSLANQPKAEEIPLDQWIPFLAEFTRNNRGAHARLDIVGADTDVGYQVQTETRPFDGASADARKHERNVWIAFGSTADDHITHGIQGATVIRQLPPTPTRGSVLEVEASDGTKTILQLTNPGDFELPPPGNTGSSR